MIVESQRVAEILLGLAVILVASKVVGDLFERLRQPAVLGEILAGVILGNLGLVGLHPTFLHDPVLAVLAEVGVVMLLFEVGLESNVTQMLRVGVSSFIVAVVGVVAPMALGWGVAKWMLPDLTWHAHVFVGAILTATSVGITARVLKDLNKIDTTEGRIILGAAVIDDVLGLIVLAVVGGIVAGAAPGGGGIGAPAILWIIAKAVLFLGGALVLGGPVSKVLFRAACWLNVRGLLLATALAFCFFLAWLARAVGLAPIVGAFAAGLVLDEVQYQRLREREKHGLEEQIHPIAGFLVPIFFVVTGSHVDLRVFTDPSTVGLAAALTAAAVVGKQVCGLAVRSGLDRVSVGVGMIPSGEVGLIFAAEGVRLGVVDGHTNAAIVVMVFATTLITPPVLAWTLSRRRA